MSGGWPIFLAFVILFIIAAGAALFSRSGSGIERRPHDGSDQALGAEGPSEISGGTDPERQFDEHGTR